MPNIAVPYVISIVTLLVTIVLVTMSFFGRNKFVVDGRTVLITGGSQGMGRGLAKLLSSKGANVVIVARDEKKLAEALAYISSAAKSPQQRFHSISADVTSPEENERILREVTAWNHDHPPDIVWANAGMAKPMLFLDSSINTLKSQMDINYFSAVYLARATLRLWLDQGAKSGKISVDPPARHFLMTSSVASFTGLVGYSPYAPCKAALRSFHDCLRSELNLYNSTRASGDSEMKVHTVFPGTILSPGYENENKTKHPTTKILEEDDKGQTEDQVAIAAVSELEKGRHLITTQFLSAAMRASSLQGSIRDRWFVDTVFSWVTALVWLFVAPDLENKVKKWAKEHGRPVHEALS